MTETRKDLARLRMALLYVLVHSAPLKAAGVVFFSGILDKLEQSVTASARWVGAREDLTEEEISDDLWGSFCASLRVSLRTREISDDVIGAVADELISAFRDYTCTVLELNEGGLDGGTK